MIRPPQIAVGLSLVLRGVLAAGAPAEGAATATMTCEPAAKPGRIRCSIEARPPPDASISWGEVVLVTLPPFADTLRGRVGPREAASREPDHWRWDVALVARSGGEGAVGGRVRLVVCAGSRCTPQDVPFLGHVAVAGADAGAGAGAGQ